MNFTEVSSINLIPTCMHQDRDGFIWIGTRGGLVKFDGNSYKILRSGPKLISGNSIVSILEDRDGILWFALNGGGINSLNKNTGEITRYSYNTTDSTGLIGTPLQYYLQALTEDKMGRIWIASYKGMSRYDKKKRKFAYYVQDNNTTNSLISNSTFSIYADSKGFLWIGYSAQEKDTVISPFDLSRFNPETGEFIHFDIVENEAIEYRIRYLLEDPDGTMWIAYIHKSDSIAVNHIKTLDPLTGKTKEHFFYKNNRNILVSKNIYQLAIFKHDPDYLFINFDAFDHPLTIQMNRKTGAYTFYHNDPKDTSDNNDPGFRYMIEDRSGILWGIDPFGKLYKREPSFAKFQVLKKKPSDANSIPSHKITRMVEDKDTSHIIWLGTLDQGLIRWDRKKNTFYQYPSIHGDTATLPAKYIIGLADLGNGLLAIGSLTKNGKLSILDKEAGTFRKHLDIVPVNYILPDRNNPNLIWCTGVSLGLVLVNIQTNEVTKHLSMQGDQTTITNNLTYWVTQDATTDNYLWIASATGLNRFDKNTKSFKRYFSDPQDWESIPDMRINSLADYGDKTLWVCTAGGLARFNKATGKCTVYNRHRGFPTDFIYTVVKQKDILWIQTDIGILRFNPKEPENIKIYGSSDGVTPFIYQGALMTSDGNIFFSGSLKGPTYFHPQDITLNPFKPPVFLTSLKQGGIPMDFEPTLEHIKSITLDWDENFFEFEYIALNYINQDKNQHQYKLEGFDNTWFHAGKKTFGRYSNLKGGHYTLRIRGSNDAGIWSAHDQEVALKIIVKTPFWRAWWFYSLVVLGSLAIICLFIFQQIQTGETIRISEAKFRNLVESTSDWIWETDINGVYTYSSPQVETILGYKPDEIIGKTPFDLIVPEAVNQTKKIFMDSANQGASIIALENVNFHKHGHRIVLETNGVPVLTKTGKLIGYRGVDRDITERKHAEALLKKSVQMFKAVFNNTFEFIGLLTTTGTLIEANQTALKFKGLKESDVIGKKYWETSWWEHSPELQEFVRNAVKRAASGEFVRKEVNNIGPDDKLHYVDFSLKPVRDDEGSIIFLVPEGRDITDIKNAEAELDHLRNYLSNIIDSMPSVLIGVDINNIITQWNTEAQRITGVPARQAIGKPLDYAFPRLAKVMDHVHKALSTHEVQTLHGQARRENNETLYEDVTIYPLATNGMEGAVIRVDDITERVRIEEMIVQSEKMLSVGGLAAGMAHEINNPLAGMMQTANVMAMRLQKNTNTPANKKAAAMAGTTIEAIQSYMDKRGILRMTETINESGRRVAAIVDNMLSFARKNKVKTSLHNFTELIDKTLELAATDYDLKKTYDFRRIKIIKKYGENIPPVPCEGAKIQQVLLNILRNGAQAMQEHGTKNPRLILRVGYEKEQNMVCMEIEDNGPGMDKKVTKRVFEPFFTTKPVGIGTGLGLSVSYFIITENHEGTILAESQPGKGAKFIIKLPLKRKNIN